MVKERKCKDIVGKSCRDTVKDVRRMYLSEDRQEMDEYGLSFDWVSPETFRNQDEGYFRWQLSWGGPSDEFRFYGDASGHVFRIEYWYMDWFDGASVTLQGEDKGLMLDVFEYLTGGDAAGIIERTED